MPIPLLTRFRNHPTNFNELEKLERSFLDLTISHDRRNDILKTILEIILGQKLRKSAIDHILSSNKNLHEHSIFSMENNLRGLHVFRMIFSYYASVMRSRRSVYSNKYHTLGYVQINDFLPNNLHQVACEEIEKVTELSSNKQPFNRPPFNDGNIELYKALYDVVLRTTGLLNSSSAYNLFYNNTFVQKILNRPNDNDIQKVFHSDIFFPAVKFWYFPSEVTHEGAFQYVPNSVDLTNEKILDWHYNQSSKASLGGEYESWRGDGHKEGSFRISMEEIRYLGLHRQTMKVKSNTLIIANVNGFHRRGDVSVSTYRNAIHGSIRIGQPMDVYPE